MAIDAVLFDIFSTLAFIDPHVISTAHALEAALAGVGLDEWLRERHRTERQRLCGVPRTLDEQLATMVSGCGGSPSSVLIGQLAAIERAAWRQGVGLYPDSVSCLHWLRERGLKVGLVSNVSCEAALAVHELELEAEADFWVLSCDIGVAKPDPDIYLHSLNLAATPPRRALFVDDLSENLEAAAALGMRTALIRREAGGDVVTNHPLLRDLQPIAALLLHAGDDEHD